MDDEQAELEFEQAVSNLVPHDGSELVYTGDEAQVPEGGVENNTPPSL